MLDTPECDLGNDTHCLGHVRPPTLTAIRLRVVIVDFITPGVLVIVYGMCSSQR